MRRAGGQRFGPGRAGCRTTLGADLAVNSRWRPVAGMLARIMGTTLGEEMQRALATLAEIAAARTIVGRGAAERPDPAERAGRRTRVSRAAAEPSV